MRKSIYIDGMNHGKNPVPAASVAGNILTSGGIFGMDGDTGKLAETPVAQCAWMFRHIQSIVDVAGTSVDNIIKVTFYTEAGFDRTIINTEWEKMFPDPQSLPARHVKTRSEVPAGMFLQCDFLAVLDA